ncbi:hypothetical protein TIFTF001_030647 [Ficus carica]|uniref:Uncharacterized protein n=1 Tax=Ficus carica TaxID=3494 RepID=A0AA88DTT3_FICCA|nr:hypothetical protein TIFTF001_030647 [Ficus carica]
MVDDLSAKATGIVKRGALVAMKGEKVKNLYKLIGKTVVGGAISREVFFCCARSCKSEIVQQVGGDN